MSVCPLSKLQWPFVCRHFLFIFFSLRCIVNAYQGRGSWVRLSSSFLCRCVDAFHTRQTSSRTLPNYHMRNPCPFTLESEMRHNVNCPFCMAIYNSIWLVSHVRKYKFTFAEEHLQCLPIENALPQLGCCMWVAAALVCHCVVRLSGHSG